MKRLTTLLILTLCTAAVAFGSPRKISATELLNRYSRAKNLEKTSIGWLLMGLGNLFSGSAASGVHSVDTYDFSMCYEGTIAALNSDVRNLDISQFDAVVSNTSGGVLELVLVKCNRNAIREVLIIESSDDYCDITHIKGNIKPENFSGIM